MATMTAPITIIKRNGVTQAFIRSFTINETYNLANVQGLGSLVDIEAPPVKIDCTASFDFYLTTFRDSAINDAIKRNALSFEDFVNEFILKDGITIEIYKKVAAGTTNDQGLKNAEFELVGTIPKLFITGDSMNLSEGAVGGRTQTFKYLDPILYKDVV